jgi:endonuclease/exonuclease/phosphatase family metal-dependent hydrolase
MSTRSRRSNTDAIAAVLGALTFVLGAQSMRVLFASITWYLRDTLGVATLDLIPVALAPFLAGALLPVLARIVGVRSAMWTGLAVLGAARIANQAIDRADADFWTAAVATAAFVGLLPLLLALGRHALVGGVLLGLTVDTAIRGLGNSLDLAYQPGIGPLLVVSAVVAAAMYCLSQIGHLGRSGVGWGRGALLLGLGPYFFAQFLVLQAQGWTSAAGAVSATHALVRISLLNVIAVWTALRFGRARWVQAASAVVVGLAVVAAEASPVLFNTASILAVVAAGPLLMALVPDPGRGRIGASSVYLVGASVLFLVIGLAYYLPMDLALGFTQAQARIAAAAALGIVGLLGAAGGASATEGVNRPMPVLAAVTLVLPLVGTAAALRPDLVGPSDPPGTVRVMTYNLHSAFDTSGRMDVEAIARVIEDSSASVVGLQEVSRGRLLNAGTDLVALLAQRLGFEYTAFFGTTDPAWGNAILSRYPLGEVERTLLPRAGTPLRRGYLAAPVQIGDDEVLFVSTHLQHVNDPDVHDDDPESDLLPVHRAQLGVVLEEWRGRTPAVLVGDFNARPGWAQMEDVLAAGWVDSWVEAGRGDGFTANAADPRYRIDWILHTPELAAIDAGVFQSQASDHFAVIADLQLPG